jgi:DNA-directed RNA polymerase specialized sigma24 family protein
MDPDVRVAFVLHDLVELPAEEAATITQTSAEVVRRRAHRARLMLRGFLDRLHNS